MGSGPERPGRGRATGRLNGVRCPTSGHSWCLSGFSSSSTLHLPGPSSRSSRSGRASCSDSRTLGDGRRPRPPRPSAEPVPRHDPDRDHARRIPRVGRRCRVARRAARRTAQLPRRSCRADVGHRRHVDPRLLHAGVRRTRPETARHATRREVGARHGAAARPAVDAHEAGGLAAVAVDRHRGARVRRRPDPAARGGQR